MNTDEEIPQEQERLSIAMLPANLRPVTLDESGDGFLDEREPASTLDILKGSRNKNRSLFEPEKMSIARKKAKTQSILSRDCRVRTPISDATGGGDVRGGSELAERGARPSKAATAPNDRSNTGGSLAATSSTQVDRTDCSMLGELYNASSHMQLGSHKITYASLAKTLERVVSKFEKDESLTFCDLGCSAGANAVELYKVILAFLEKLGERRQITMVCEDLPTTDYNVLVQTLAQAKLPNNERFFPMCVGKSFFEQVVPDKSVHLSLSYIALQWMRSPPRTPRSESWVAIDEPQCKLEDNPIREAWRRASIDDLVLFLEMRARELKDGAEGVYMMCGGGADDALEPPNALDADVTGIHQHNGSTFRQALARAVAAGKIPVRYLHMAYIPYFYRDEGDVRESVAQVEHLFELLEIDASSVVLHDGSHDVSCIVDMMWSIHVHCLATSIGTTEQELTKLVKPYFHQVVQEQFGKRQLDCSFLYFVVRRKPRLQTILGIAKVGRNGVTRSAGPVTESDGSRSHSSLSSTSHGEP